MTSHAARMNPRLTNAIAVALVAAGESCAPAFGAAGDLDPAFGNVGRFGPATEFAGQAWSIAPHGDGGWIFAGGVRRLQAFDLPRQYVNRGYIARLRGDGALDDIFETQRSTSAYARDAAVQPDGRIVAVGLGRWNGGGTNAVWRFEAAGAAGSGLLGDGLSGGSGNSVALHPDGRIVVAGSGEGGLRVWRLLPSGEPDPSFAEAGVFVRPGSLSGVSVLSAEDGGYRLLVLDAASIPATCYLLGLDASGRLNEAFGQSGQALVATSAGDDVACRSMIELTGGGLLLAGKYGGRGFITRMTPAGNPDPAFDGDDLGELLGEARAIGVDGAGRIVVAGSGPEGTAGARVVRLHPGGARDVDFGTAGSAWVDLPNEGTGYALVNDIHVSPAGAILVAGAGTPAGPFANGSPFVARLLGDAGVGGPGVVGWERPRVAATEGAGQLALTVRRMGGRIGAVSVNYRTRTAGDGPFAAVAGEDYDEVSGQLSWADGDASDRQILIPIGPDGGSPEEEEVFEIELDAPSGGAGLGTRVGRVTVAADGAPAGLFSLRVPNEAVGEDTGTTQVEISRNYYSVGTVSVTLGLASGSATAGQDFAAEPVTVQWGEGETGSKYVDVRIIDDADREPSEQFTVRLSDATGGAVVGPRSSATITIGENDSTPPPSNPPPPGGGGAPSSGGGGALGWLSLLALALAYFGRIRRA